MNAKDDVNTINGSLSKSLINITIEAWRFGKVFERAITRLDAGEQKRFLSQYRWFTKKIEDSMDEAGMRLVNIEGQRYDPGMAATPLNLEEFESEDTLIVDQMVEPIIMGQEGLLKTGTVLLRKIDR